MRVAHLLLGSVLIAFTAALAGSGAPSTKSPVEKGMDLPVERPEKKQATRAPPPAPPPVTPIAPPPPTIYGKGIESENATICYVIDISGSMGWEPGQYVTPEGVVATGNRLARAKAEIARSVASLPRSFRFTLFAFDCSLYAFSTALLEANADNKAAALGWLAGLVEQGATGTGPAISAALALEGIKMVVLLTDGAPNCGAGDGWGGAACIEAHRVMIRSNNRASATIDVFGIGATGEFKQFCMDVAGDNDGSYSDVR